MSQLRGEQTFNAMANLTRRSPRAETLNMSKSPRRSAPPGLLSPSVCRRPTDGSFLLVLLRSDLPVIGTGLSGHGSRGSRRDVFRNDLVDVATTVTDHKQDAYHPPLG